MLGLVFSAVLRFGIWFHLGCEVGAGYFGPLSFVGFGLQGSFGAPGQLRGSRAASRLQGGLALSVLGGCRVELTLVCQLYLVLFLFFLLWGLVCQLCFGSSFCRGRVHAFVSLSLSLSLSVCVLVLGGVRCLFKRPEAAGLTTRLVTQLTVITTIDLGLRS